MQTAGTALLQTKLDIPPRRAHLLPRERLLALAPAEPGTNLVLLSAPAGFGKTTFLALWCHALAARHGVAVAWVALDEGDNDPAHFLAYLSAAVARGLAPEGAASPIEPPATTRAGIESVLTTLVNALALQERGVVLVLDDYHLISAPAVHAAVAFLLEHMPAHVCLAIGSRADPPLPLARLRARQQLVELRAADLRFTQEEVEAFFAAGDQALTAEEVQAIGTYVEGWPAGVQLVALAMRSAARQQAEADALPSEAPDESEADRLHRSYRHLFEYLAEDVFAQQPAHLKAFLVQTAVLDRMCGPLCDAVLGVAAGDHAPAGDLSRRQVGPAAAADSYSRLILDELEHANLFTAPLDSERRWFRYHHLFHAFLRDRLERDAPGVAAELHLRASVWYEHSQLLPQAVEHALAAGAPERAADLIEAAAVAVVERGEYATLRRWLARIPAADLGARPALCLWASWAALLAGEVERIDPLLEHALCAWQAAADEHRLGEVAHLQAHLARLRHDAGQTLDAARRALASLAEDQDTLRAGSLLALGAGQLLAGDLGEAGPTLSQAYAECQAHNYIGMLVALCCLGDLAVQQGQLHAAADKYQAAIRALGERDLWERWEALARLGDLARERNDLAQAEDLLHTALSAAERAGVAAYLAPGYIALARTLQARGACIEAEAALDQAAHAARRLRSAAYAEQAEAYRARLALARGDLAAAQRWYAACPPGCESTIVALTAARLLIAQDRLDSAHQSLSAAHTLLKRLRQQAESHGHAGALIETLALTARINAATGRPDLALQALDQALVLAAPQGYMRIFLDEGPSMQALLARYRVQLARQPGEAAPAAAKLGAYLDALLGAFQAPGAVRAAQLNGGQCDGLVEALSEREREVLRYIAIGASNQAIAEKLVISIGTVKSHINHILGKLAARSRTEAVARAREFGLLGS